MLGGFELQGLLGRGGMGEVFAGWHLASGSPVAVKVVTQALDDRAWLAFGREVRAVASLCHPAIVGVLDHGTVATSLRWDEHELAAGTPYLVMELADGTLEPEHIRSWGEVLAVALDLLGGLAHAHARGVIHRDVKPANILRFGDRFKLTDFGISQIAEGAGVRSSVGTPAYMAPEQIGGALRDQGPWTDLYAVACTLWELVCHALPFDRPTWTETIRAHRYEEPDPFRPVLAVPAGLEAVLRGCLAKDPFARCTRAADLALALRELGAPLAPAPHPPAGRAPSAVTFWLDDADVGADELGAPEVELGPHAWRRPPFDPEPRDEVDAVPVLLDAGLGLFGVRVPPFVGRRPLRRLLWEKLGQVLSSGRPIVVRLFGATGTGRTRLLGWLREYAHETGQAETVAFEGGLEATLRRVLRCEGLDRSGVLARLHTFAPAAAPEDVAGWVALLAPRVAGTPSDGLPERWVDTDEERAEVAARYLEALAARRPVVATLDHADDQTPELVALARRLERSEAPILVVCARRGEAPADPQEIEIPCLPLAEHEVLVAALLPLRPPIRSEVVGRTHGNPMFAVELVREWVERQVLVPDPQGHGPAVGGVLPFFEDLPAVWRARLESALGACSHEERHALELHAVLGDAAHEEDWASVCRAAGLPPTNPIVEHLERRQLMRPTPAGTALAHPLLVEAMTASAAGGARLAGWRSLACRTLHELGMRDLALGALREAQRRLSRAAAIADDLVLGSVIEASQAMAELLLGRIAAARATLELLDDRTRGMGGAAEAWTLLARSHLEYQEGETERAEASAGASLALARRLGDVLLLTWALGQLAHLLRRQARGAEALALYEEAAALTTDRAFRARILGNMGACLMDQGRAAEAQPMLEAALADHRALGDRRSEANTLHNLAVAAQEKDPEAARRGFLAAAELQRAVGHRLGAAAALLGLANVDSSLRRIDDAIRRAAEARRAFLEVGAAHYAAVATSLQARLAMATGDRPRARALLRDALGMHRSARNVGAEVNIQQRLCMLSVEEGDVSGALASGEAALALSVAHGLTHATCLCHLNLGAVHGGLGRAEKAWPHFEAALAHAGGDAQLRAVILASRGGARLQAGDLAAAREDLVRALDDLGSADPEMEPVVAASLARCLAELGEPGVAEALARAEASTGCLERPSERGEVAIHLGFAALATGERAGAVRWLREASTHLEASGLGRAAPLARSVRSLREALD